MNLSEISIRRPVLATVMSLLIVLFGGLGFIRLGIREYPAVDPPVVTVTTSYRGANPEIIDTQITEPLEQTISGIAGIRNIASTSREGSSEIRVEFTLDSDLEAAANDVRDKVSQAIRRLPADADPPTVEKADADSDPIIFLAIQSSKKNILEVSDIADTVLKERFQTIPGVSSVRIFGEKRFAMRLWLDPGKMAAHGVTPQDVFTAVDRQNVDLPSGLIEGNVTELSIRTDGRLLTEEDFNNLIVRQDSNRQILLRDVGHAEISAENLRRGNVSRGIPMIGIAVIPQPNTNAIAIADEFFRRYEQVRKELPADFEMEIGYDFTQFVRKSIVEVQETLAIAFGLVALIIFLFLRDWRSVLIPVVTIPISIIAGFFVMYVAGYSINVLTLVALVLAIGLVCDDAIVVLENVYTKIEQGMTPLQASIKGTNEIYFAVLSTTVTLAAVFVPVIFLQGLTGRLFREFGVVLVGCVIVSAFVALTLSPMMCRFMLQGKHAGHGWFFRVTEPFFVGMNWIYRMTLGGFLRARYLALPVLAAAIFAIIWGGAQLKSELAPLEDRSNIRLQVRAVEGASYDYTLANVAQLAAEIEQKYDDDLHRVFAITGTGGSNSGVVNIYLKNPEERSRTAFQVFDDISREAEQFTGLRAFPSMPPTIGDRRAGQPLRFVLQAPSLGRMNEILPKFLEEAAKHPVLRFVDADLKTNRPQARIEIDRARASELGIDVSEIARAIQLSFGETRFAYFTRNDRQYQVIGQLERPDRSKPRDLERLYVRTRGGQMVPLASLVKVTESVTPAAIYRNDRFIAATVSGGVAPGATLGDGLKAMREIAARVLPPDFSTSLTGQARDLEESSNSLLYAFIVAVLLIYLVLAAQFESWIDPFIILLTVPLSMSGALLSLWYTGQSLNVFSQIGIIMLVGLVTKNGILIVEFANQRKEAGLSVREAVLDASVSRLRPILMTSLSTILGILPIALAIGGASGSRRSLGIAVVGGMCLATFLTLYIVPAVYAFLSPEHHKREDEELEKHAEPKPSAKAGKPELVGV
jgi:multidrug efflux pump